MDEIEAEVCALIQRNKDKAAEILSRKAEIRAENMLWLRDQLRKWPLSGDLSHVNNCRICARAVLILDPAQACNEETRKSLERFRDTRGQ
jgi:hypothetical protein